MHTLVTQNIANCWRLSTLYHNSLFYSISSLMFKAIPCFVTSFWCFFELLCLARWLFLTKLTSKSSISFSSMQQNAILNELSVSTWLRILMSDEVTVFQKTVVTQFALKPSIPLARMHLNMLIQWTPFEHTSHWWCVSLEWVRLCRFHTECWTKVFEQIVQTYGRSPECIRACYISTFLAVNYCTSRKGTASTAYELNECAATANVSSDKTWSTHSIGIHVFWFVINLVDVWLVVYIDRAILWEHFSFTALKEVNWKCEKPIERSEDS